ncbi:MAG: phospholipase D-like domain-containing protein, partial [Panacagrimonas sp.]
MTSMSNGPSLFLVAHLMLAAFTAMHALMHSRDPRAAWGWIATCWLAPILGPVLYLFFGVHRVSSRRARNTRSTAPRPSAIPPLTHLLPKELEELVRIGDAVTGRRLTQDNQVEILHNGDEAYPAMLRAIDGAQRSILLSTYIFRGDDTGRAFASLLGRARQRGVDVKVLVDAVGDLYYWPRGSDRLRQEGVEVRHFQLGRRYLPLPHLNLRNHRKLLVIDEEVAYLGGLNIGDHHWAHSSNHPALDMHFEVRGAVLADLHAVFQEDWCTAGGTPLQAAATAPSKPQGGHFCRVVTDG